MSTSIVMTTCKDEKEAMKIADAILGKKLAACVKMSDAKTSYWWNGKVERNEEAILSVMTPKKNVAKVIAEIKKAHSYDTPEIVEIPVLKGDKRYMRWISDVTE